MTEVPKSASDQCKQANMPQSSPCSFNMTPCLLASWVRRRRPILQFPSRTTKTFPERDSEWSGVYPALIKPWLGGVRAYWVEDLQAFQLEDGHVVRVDGIEPLVPDDVLGFSPKDLLGEFYEKNVSYEDTLQNVVQNEPTPNLNFNVFDAEMDNTAIQRAEYCTNLPEQHSRHVQIAQMIQVNTPGGFRTWLDGWRVSFKGALAVGYQDPWLATEHEVKTLLQ